MVGYLIIALAIIIIAYFFYRHYFLRKTQISSTKPHFTLKIEHE